MMRVGVSEEMCVGVGVWVRVCVGVRFAVGVVGETLALVGVGVRVREADV
jgi:hypothetical protein